MEEQNENNKQTTGALNFDASAERAAEQNAPPHQSRTEPKAKKKQEISVEPVILTDDGIRYGSLTMAWTAISEYRPIGRPVKLEIVSSTGQKIIIPKDVQIYYAHYPISLGGDPFPFIINRIAERSPNARHKSVSDTELMVLLAVLNAEFFAVILSFALRINLAATMLAAAVLGLAAGLGFPKLREMNLSELSKKFKK